jgi:hypothetical protein
MSILNEIIIYPDVHVPQVAFAFLDYLHMEMEMQLGVKDIETLRKPRTASGAQQLATMEKISEQRRMREHVNRR